MRRNGIARLAPAGAIESSSRFEGASEMEAKAIKSIDLIALACLIVSQDYLPIDRSPGGAIPIVYDDRDGRRRATCDGVRRRRLHTWVANAPRNRLVVVVTLMVCWKIDYSCASPKKATL